jgi:hypothetical protein
MTGTIIINNGTERDGERSDSHEQKENVASSTSCTSIKIGIAVITVQDPTHGQDKMSHSNTTYTTVTTPLGLVASYYTKAPCLALFCLWLIMFRQSKHSPHLHITSLLERS